MLTSKILVLDLKLSDDECCSQSPDMIMQFFVAYEERDQREEGSESDENCACEKVVSGVVFFVMHLDRQKC